MKQFSFQFSHVGDRQFRKLHKTIQDRILSKLEEYETQGDPLRFSKKLRGMENRYRFRIGDYRVICSQQSNGVIIVLLILAVGHRRDVYDKD